MMRRTTRFLVILALGLLVAPLAADAQQPRKVPRIGWLSVGYDPCGARHPVSEPRRGFWQEAFLQGLHELGYVEGQNLIIEWRYAEDRAERLSDVASLARPGGNITGLSIQAVEVGGKRLELLKAAVPQASRVAVLWEPGDPAKALEWQDTQIAARALGVRLHAMEVRGADDFDHAFAAITGGRPDALITVTTAFTLRHQRQIVDFTTQNQLPMMAEGKEFAEAGGLMSYGASLPALYRRAAYYVDRILKGAKPADLPVEQPTTFELVINLKTAQALGLTIPPAVLFQATEVIR